MVPIFDPQQMKDLRDLTPSLVGDINGKLPMPWIYLSFSIMWATQQETYHLGVVYTTPKNGDEHVFFPHELTLNS